MSAATAGPGVAQQRRRSPRPGRRGWRARRRSRPGRRRARRRALQLRDRLGQLGVALVERGQHGVEVGDDPADHLVAVGERAGQRGGAPQQVGDGAALALQHLDDLVREAVDVLRGERGEQRPEAVEQHGQVERGRGLRQRDQAVSGSSAVAAAGPRSARGSAGRPGSGSGSSPVRRVASGDRVVDRELHLGGRAVDEPDVGDLADLDPGDAHVVAVEHPGDVGEPGAVGGAAAEPEARRASAPARRSAPA